jgi:hypothetical protein
VGGTPDIGITEILGKQLSEAMQVLGLRTWRGAG